MKRRHWLLLGLAGLLIGGQIWWMEGGQKLFRPFKWGVVSEDSFYRSAQIHERIVEGVLRENGIDLIVDLASNDPPRDPHEAAEREAAKRLGIRRIELSIRPDGRGHAADYVVAIREIQQARSEGQQVLVHCNAGRERTGALVAMVRMLFEDWDGGDAFDEYLSYRDRPPEEPEMEDLVARLLPDVAAGLEESGLLSSVPRPLPVLAPRKEP